MKRRVYLKWSSAGYFLIFTLGNGLEWNTLTREENQREAEKIYLDFLVAGH